LEVKNFENKYIKTTFWMGWGGKSKFAKQIVSLMPEHKLYIEVLAVL